MDVYKFQYTNVITTNLIFFGCVIACVNLFFAGLRLALPLMLTIVLNSVVTIFLFQILKRFARHTCVAQLSENSMVLQLKNKKININFSELVSFKTYYGRSGPVLYLETKNDKLKLSANTNFCKTNAFKSFCEELVIVLDNYKVEHNATLIRKNGIFETKGMLYFLIIATVIYPITFFIEVGIWRIVMEIAVGFFLFNMWVAYFINNKKEKSAMTQQL